jgi:D-glycero-D-manno-heptose 1,7-bisphosphate phosphatase
VRNKAVFFDRDGIINIDKGYVSDSDDFEFVDGIHALIRHINSKKLQCIVVTNQSGIARGMYSVEQFKRLTQWMLDTLLSDAAIIDDVYFCPHHPSAGDTSNTRKCICRKPQPGMLFFASVEHDIDLTQSIMIGDSERDIEAAIIANLKQAIWVTSTTDPVALERLHYTKEAYQADTQITIVPTVSSILATLRID